MPIDAVRFIKGLREDNGLRSEEIATILKVSHMTIWNWIHGRAKPSPLAEEAIRKLAQGLQGGRAR